uniref:Uncharacterized protein n=1 Tax=Cacopsylla melanoneura TaxID=428564 RepID=A0A8D8SEF9_9HEMI
MWIHIICPLVGGAGGGCTLYTSNQFLPLLDGYLRRFPSLLCPGVADVLNKYIFFTKNVPSMIQEHENWKTVARMMKNILSEKNKIVDEMKRNWNTQRGG